MSKKTENEKANKLRLRNGQGSNWRGKSTKRLVLVGSHQFATENKNAIRF